MSSKTRSKKEQYSEPHWVVVNGEWFGRIVG
ncbi:BnaC04g53840D [Brassica napus]|uniref:BnaC04g53840D protein n=1 Tax=Brassica napus TaxID=3708 RepID=A0A078ISM0_BRANA|nr:BnaC04g53840D [Brassica napus]